MLQILLNGQKNGPDRQAQQVSAPAASSRVKITRPKHENTLSGRRARARMGPNGHFYFDSRMNGARVRVMVDTGASGVAINRSTARKLGIHLSNADFKYESRTANGIARFAAATIDEIRIGRIIVYDVRAAVLKDSSLSQTLLGMTFLRKLRKFEVNGDTLTLTQ